MVQAERQEKSAPTRPPSPSTPASSPTPSPFLSFPHFPHLSLPVHANREMQFNGTIGSNEASGGNGAREKIRNGIRLKRAVVGVK